MGGCSHTYNRMSFGDTVDFGGVDPGCHSDRCLRHGNTNERQQACWIVSSHEMNRHLQCHSYL